MLAIPGAARVTPDSHPTLHDAAQPVSNSSALPNQCAHVLHAPSGRGGAGGHRQELTVGPDTYLCLTHHS
jgi:hypothetical protein